MAYKLESPQGCLLHPIFHVSLLKKHVVEEGQVVVSSPPLTTDEGQVRSEPETIQGRRLIKRNNQAVTQVLVKWENLHEEDATWEDYNTLKSQFLQVKKR